MKSEQMRDAVVAAALNAADSHALNIQLDILRTNHFTCQTPIAAPLLIPIRTVAFQIIDG